MFFYQYRHGWLGQEQYTGHTTIGWKVTYRRGFGNRPVCRERILNPSRFGVLRQLIQAGRDWHGKIFPLTIESIEPIVKVHYELVD